MELHPSAGSGDPAPFALVSALYGYFANGAAGRIIFAPHVGFEVGKGGVHGLIEIPNSIQPAELGMERYQVNSALVWCECVIYRGPVMCVFLTDMLIYRRPLTPNDLFH